MSFQNLRKKIEHYPEVLGIILFFALMMTQPVSEQYLYKVYSEKYGIPYKFDSSKTGCPIGNDTNSNKTLLTQQVQSEVSKFLTVQLLLLNIPPVVSVLYFGPLSDRYGRKPFMILAASGLLFLTLTIIIVDITGISLMFYHLGALICGMCGHLPGLVSMYMCYLSDVVSKEKLPIRLAIIDLIIFISIGSSNFLSGVILDVLGFLYSFVFVAVFFLISILLMVFQLKESLHKDNISQPTMHWIKSPMNIYKLLKAPRSQKWRLRMLIPIDSLTTMTSQVVIGPILLLRLLNRPFCWSSKEIGFYRGSYYFMSGVGSVFAVKIFPKCFHKVFVILVSNISTFAYLIILGLFETRGWYYIAIAASIFSFASPPMTKSLLGSYVNDAERGALFSLTASLQSIIQSSATFLFQYLYRQADKHGKPGTVFVAVSFALSIPFILSIVYMMRDVAYERREKRRRLVEEDKPSDSSLHETDPLLSS